jgi:adenylyltransferase/sulfurtransferase
MHTRTRQPEEPAGRGKSMLSPREKERYSRQILLFGEEGQEKLKNGTIFIAGAGGLGSPISLYLAVLGIGTIILVDDDIVERSNLNRQILHSERDIGRKKTQSAQEKLQAINPDISVRVIDTTIDESNVHDLVGNADGIVDAMDNFATRYLLNEVSQQQHIPLFHGAVRGLFGQATTILPGNTPCFRCIFPHPPPKDVLPVVGLAPGFIGMVQATEVFKFLLGDGDLLANRLLLWDGMQSRVEEIPLVKNPSCDVCGDR